MITEYFRSIDGGKPTFNTAATNEQIAELESHFGIEFPTDYIDFLKASNGFEGFINEFVVKFSSIEEIYERTKDTCSNFFPWAIYIGSNGNLEMFIINIRHHPYSFGLLPYIGDANDFIPLGDSFEKFVIRLYNDTAYQTA